MGLFTTDFVTESAITGPALEIPLTAWWRRGKQKVPECLERYRSMS